MNTNIDTASFFTFATGEHPPDTSIQKIIRFDRYEIEINLSKTGQFMNISSIKVHKDFTESIKSTINPTVHDVEKYYREY